jgi:hypothetical protein
MDVAGQKRLEWKDWENGRVAPDYSEFYTDTNCLESEVVGTRKALKRITTAIAGMP